MAWLFSRMHRSIPQPSRNQMSLATAAPATEVSTLHSSRVLALALNPSAMSAGAAVRFCTLVRKSLDMTPSRRGSHKDGLRLRSHAMRHVHVTGPMPYAARGLETARSGLFESCLARGCWNIRYACLLGFAAADALAEVFSQLQAPLASRAPTKAQTVSCLCAGWLLPARPPAQRSYSNGCSYWALRSFCEARGPEAGGRTCACLRAFLFDFLE